MSVVFCIAARAAVPRGLTQEVTLTRLQDGARATRKNNAFFAGGVLRLESISDASGARAEEFYINISTGRAWRSGAGSVCGEIYPDKAKPAPLLYAGPVVSAGWNNLTGRQAVIKPLPVGGSGGCREYSIRQEFQMSNFRTGGASEGRLEGNARLCAGKERAAAGFAAFDKRYRAATGAPLNPLDEAAFAVADVSAIWAIRRDDVERLARDILNGLALLKGKPASLELTWWLPSPPDKHLRSLRFQTDNQPRRRQRFMPIGPLRPSTERRRAWPGPALRVLSKTKYLGDSAVIAAEVLKLPPACRKEKK
ncbi:MAG: hypothetical protein PHP45_10230 [Elusimicrobiales bacterium]|nr:hypothetical protein [Elusimicrobiales bacterium]